VINAKKNAKSHLNQQEISQYCSDCFRKDESPRYNSRNQDTSFKSSMSSEEFEQINAKLDKIIQALDIDSEEDERQND